jgi:hypothetical protein
MKTIIITIGLIISVITIVLYAEVFDKVDECLDNGHSWHNYSNQCIEDFDELIYKETIKGNVYITLKNTKIQLNKQKKAPNGTIYMQGEHKINLGDNKSTVDHIFIKVDKVEQLGDISGNTKYYKYLMPFAIDGGGSGTFWYLGLFKADFKYHKLILLDKISLGDRVTEISTYIGKKGKWVSFKTHSAIQAMADNPNIIKKINLTFSKNLDQFTVPIKTNLSYLDLNKFNEYKYEFNKSLPSLPEFWVEDFYALGYSNDHKFAYMRNHISNEAGIIFIEVFVQDLVTDKIIWRHEFLSGENPPDNISFKSFWIKNHQYITEKLKYYGIHSDKLSYPQDGDILYKSDKLKYRAKNKKLSRYTGYMPTVTQNIIYLTSEKYGTKIISKKIFKEESYQLDIQPIGYFNLGKNNTKIALIIAHVGVGHEGPPHNIRYSIIGADLKKGFK